MHIIKYPFNSNYRAATKLAKEANTLFAAMLVSSKAVGRVMPDELLKASEELDESLNQYERGEISKDELESKRQDLHRELQSWNDSLEDRQWW